MVKWGILFVSIWLGACSSSHKLTGTDYVDIERESPPALPADYPLEVIEDAGWTEMATDIKKNKKDEEFRFWFSTSIPPSGLYKINKNGKEVEGEHIIYWKRSETNDTSGFLHQYMKRYLEGACEKIHETESYGYCYPVYEDVPKWQKAYHVFEARNIWHIPDITTLNIQPAEEETWKIYSQVKLGNYYRDFEHVNPEQYDEEEIGQNVYNLTKSIHNVSWGFNDALSTNLISGVTNGNNLILCDSSESWELKGNLEKLLAFNGYETKINTQDSDTFYFVTLKGQVQNNWYSDRIKENQNRKLIPYQIYTIQVAKNKECPESLAN
ncbi:MAG: hypothetical protein WD059_15840 [Balneolaceae bacterium]